jgi:ribonuclease HI
MVKLFTDGGARGNPGPAAGAAVLYDNEGNVIFKASEYYGTATNNQAEYRALMLGLILAINKNILDISAFLDSELVVRQLNGQYKVKDKALASLFSAVKNLESKFSSVSYSHVPRSQNKEADLLVNTELDRN